MSTEPRKDTISWDECFMRIAHVISDRSKDPSTQAGALIADQNNIVVGLGYNGFPRSTNDNAFTWDREGSKLSETKYAYVCHAEENAIYNSNKQPHGCKLYTTLFPCNECAKTIVQNGITEIIYESDKYHDDDIWVASRKILDAAGVTQRQIISEANKK